MREVDAGPAYMVEPIEKMTAIDDQTLELQLDRPINPFLDWLASPYGLKMINPDVIEKNEKDDDAGQDYLADHCAGTGPYDLTSADPGQRYELAANTELLGHRARLHDGRAAGDPELLDAGSTAARG